MTNGNGRGPYNKNGWNNNHQRNRNEKKQDKPQVENRPEGEKRPFFSQTKTQVDMRQRNNQRQNDRQRGWRDAPKEKNKGRPGFLRPKWTPPDLLRSPIPTPLCPICKNVIEDVSAAITDKVSGEVAHFDCVRDKITENEALVKGQVLTYIGGGRFGIIDFKPEDKRCFKIKKIIEWEKNDTRAAWRSHIADHFSMT